MNTWTTPATIEEKLIREWQRGRILTAILGEDTLFPLRIPLKGPTSREWVDQFSMAQKWIASIGHHSNAVAKFGYRLEWREFNHRTLGRNRVPVAAVFDTARDAVTVLKREEDVEKVEEAWILIVAAFGELEGWAKDNPLKVLDYAADWPRILAVLRWVRSHPRSELYIRQVDIPGVDTKFIERTRGLMIPLLDRVLASPVVDTTYHGATAFAERYGFRAKPPLVRFRLLDPSCQIAGYTDLSVMADEFAGQPLDVERIFVIENEIDFLAFPHLANAMAIFGAGYGLRRFEGARWLNGKEVYYWGDIDTHGFAILDEFRQYVPAARSMLMDRKTLNQYREFWGIEDKVQRRTLTRLTPNEAALYQDMLDGRYGYGVRLEQEQIPISAVRAILCP